MGEQEKLLRCEIQRNATPLGALMARVDFQIGDAQLLPACGRTTQERTDACEQFRKREWFYHVVIRTKLQSFYTVRHAVARRQKNDRRLHLSRSQFFHQGPTVLFRKHDIHNEEVECARTCCSESRLA